MATQCGLRATVCTLHPRDANLEVLVPLAATRGLRDAVFGMRLPRRNRLQRCPVGNSDAESIRGARTFDTQNRGLARGPLDPAIRHCTVTRVDAGASRG